MDDNEDGATHSPICDTCGEKYNGYEENHSFNNSYWGQYDYEYHGPKCDKCNYIKDDMTDLEPHTYNDCLFISGTDKDDNIIYYLICDNDCANQKTEAWVPYKDSTTSITYLLNGTTKEAVVLNGR